MPLAKEQWASFEEYRQSFLGIISPNPSRGIRKNGRTVPAAVDALPKDELVVIALFVQGGGHCLIRFGPASVLVHDVVGPVLLEHADWLFGDVADQLRILISAADVREAADGGEALAKLVWPLPANGE